MPSGFRIALEARNPQRNCLRAWRLSLECDLLGDWVVRVGYGRIGRPGRELTHVFAAKGEAIAHARLALRRRAGAPRRIGTPYRTVAHDKAALPLLQQAGLA